ncbi:NUC153 domain-containing protein [Mycena indigotica]|uniref:NUC153 domain-containing protein n=1 Tax=Mycena indigotica TaxID=2126181 RepID=A0A8H6WC16_9AGAR|nr:NUC153 domain-containing protein [Mycena indigotica]KAF7306879.1 NUC153 domain-containing protein [Mycena indigotica]
MDSRFARLRTDPRFRRPRKEKSKVVVDQRFKAVFQPKSSKGRVDKYGRPISATQDHEDLRRFYRLEKEEEPTLPDYARGEALLESSDEDDESESETGSHRSDPINLTAQHDTEVDLDETDFADLDAQAAEYSKAHPDKSDAETAQTNRLAAVNLDWDHVRAAHLFKICSSLVSPTAAPLKLKKKSEASAQGGSRVARGTVTSVRIYPSEFGQERMAREEREGPPPEIFKKTTADEEDVNERNIYNVGDGNDYDDDALRKYQLERLRYFYAVITCDTVEAAAHIYSELEGTELERSANTFDLSFVPDGMTFDQEFRDEATEEASTDYKGVDFVTDALRHSKVKLTWDDDDPERNRITRRTLTRKEIEENDYKNLLASSSEDESEGEQRLSRDKLRSLLLDKAGDELPEGWNRDEDKGDVDMEITFTPGLSDIKSTGDETTLEKYQRKMKEKRKQKKAENSAAKPDTPDEFFEDEETGKGDKPTRTASTAEELSLLITAGNSASEPKHFDMKAIVKAEKEAKRKGKKKRKLNDVEGNEMQEDFSIDVHDARFAGLHEDHAFAIDPSNPHFRKTEGMAALLDERAKRQKQKRDMGEKKRSNDPSGRTLESLVESVKSKSVGSNGKRRKMQ